MPEPLIFKDLPATFPETDKYKKPSVIGSVLFHGFLIFAVIIVPLLMPQTMPERELLVTIVSPIGPPPPPPPPPLEVPVAAMPKAVQRQARSVLPDALIAPLVVPKEIVKIVDEPVAPTVGMVGGVTGGMPGGLAGGVLGGVLSTNITAPPALAAPSPPPPPPPPAQPAVTPSAPLRAGGIVKEPKLVKLVPPVYPVLASRARIAGTVILEATLTVEGSVEEIRIVSGHPLLIQAAIDCVKQWRYEPTYLNGVPVAIILTAKVHFLKAPLS